MQIKPEPPSIGLVVLAAGASKRLGVPKQLLPFQQKTLLQYVLDQAKEYPFATKVLVLGAHSSLVLESIDPGDFSVLIHEGWEKGMASSLIEGVAHARADCPSLGHLLVLLADQPFVSAKLIRSLIDCHLEQGNPITACSYQGQLGVPAVFHKSFFPELQRLEGDRGANSLIRGQGSKVGAVPFEQGSFDVDTWDDFRQLSNWKGDL